LAAKRPPPHDGLVFEIEVLEGALHDPAEGILPLLQVEKLRPPALAKRLQKNGLTIRPETPRRKGVRVADDLLRPSEARA
ncbi:hypothetical protein, partial [Rhodoplanes roseus]|uniref:hypothetical protein n=1 Tax=Rhodoplanes roseus TaxID=29409 RepID=UPI001AECEF01